MLLYAGWLWLFYIVSGFCFVVFFCIVVVECWMVVLLLF